MPGVVLNFVDGAIAEAASAETGDVEETIDAAEFGEALSENAIGGVREGEISGPAFGAGFGGEFKAGELVAGGDEEACAFGGGEACGFGADAGRAGDDDDFFMHDPFTVTWRSCR